MKRYILLLVAALVSVATLSAQDLQSEERGKFLPMRQRVNRNIDRNKFLLKGEVMLGLTASYGTLKAEDSDLMLLLDGIDVGLNSASVNPFFAYAYRDNRAVGLRLGYDLIDGNLGNIDVDLGLIAEGIDNLSLSDLALRNESFSWSLFHRNYVGLDRRGIVGVIIEQELKFKNGTSRITTGSGDEASSSLSRNFSAKLNFNSGLGVYVFPQVCLTVTVGIGGLSYNNIRQYDAAHEVIGRRDQSSMKFKLNIANIQIGLVAHLWNNKK